MGAVILVAVIAVISLAIRFVAVPWALVFLLGVFDVTVGYWVALVITFLLSWIVNLIKK